MTPFGRAFAQGFATALARPATYTAPGGEPVAVRVILGTAEGRTDIEGAGVRTARDIASLLRSEVAEPVKNGRLELDGVVYLLSTRRLDESGTVWTCGLVRQ